MFRLTMLFVLFFTVSAKADYAWIDSAKWSGVLGYTKCGFFGSCTLYQQATANTKNASVGDFIRITDRGKEVDEFNIRGIAYESQTKKCWITKKSGESDTYLTVSGCRPR